MFWSSIINRFKSEKQKIEDLVNDHKKFDDFVYTESLEEAVKILEERRKDKKLIKKVEKYLRKVGVPEPFKDEPRLVIFRQVATPNIEISRFLIASDGINFKPLFIEYLDDKFTSNNEWKKYLGKLAFYEGVGKKGGHKINYHTIIDFNSFDGKKIADVVTRWGHKLSDFHKSLFYLNYRHIQDDFFYDASSWFKKCGGSAKKYYSYLTSLYIVHGILFENFLLDKKDEYEFSKEIFLPEFIKIYNKFGLKPLIVPVSPTNIETAEFWLCHNPETRKWFEKNMVV